MDFLLYNFVAERKPAVDTLDDLSLPSLNSIAVEFGMVKEIASTERKRVLFYCVCGPIWIASFERMRSGGNFQF